MAPDIQVNSAGHFLVIGALNFDTVPQLNLRGRQLVSASPIPIFDLRSVTRSDNSGLALIISWIRYAKQINKSIRFLNIPQQLLAIAEISGLLKSIPINNTKRDKQTHG